MSSRNLVPLRLDLETVMIENYESVNGVLATCTAVTKDSKLASNLSWFTRITPSTHVHLDQSLGLSVLQYAGELWSFTKGSDAASNGSMPIYS